jgi:hypothetical protein
MTVSAPPRTRPAAPSSPLDTEALFKEARRRTRRRRAGIAAAVSAILGLGVGLFAGFGGGGTVPPSGADGGSSTELDYRFGPQVDVSRAPGPQIESSIAVDPARPEVLVAAAENEVFDRCGIRVYGSTDGGASWTSQLLGPPPGDGAARDVRGLRFCPVANEWVAIDSSGRQYVAYVAFGARRRWSVFVSSRGNASGSWSPPTQIDPSQFGFADKPMLLADNWPTSPHRGRLYLGWTVEKSAASYSPAAEPVYLSHSDDRGRSWSTPIRVAAPGGWGVHLAVGADGSVYVAWRSDPGLEIARSTDGGATFTARRFAVLPHALTDFATVAASPSEPIVQEPSLDLDRSGRFADRLYAAYNSLLPSGGLAVTVTALDARLHRVFSRVVTPRTSDAHDEFNPTVAVDQSNGTVWLCFYLTGTGSQRDATRALATYSCSRSTDGGSHWTQPTAVASVASDEQLPGAFSNGLDSNYGSYEGLAAANGVAHPIWTDTRRLKRLGEETYTTSVR